MRMHRGIRDAGVNLPKWLYELFVLQTAVILFACILFINGVAQTMMTATTAAADVTPNSDEQHRRRDCVHWTVHLWGYINCDASTNYTFCIFVACATLQHSHTVRETDKAGQSLSPLSFPTIYPSIYLQAIAMFESIANINKHLCRCHRRRRCCLLLLLLLLLPFFFFKYINTKNIDENASISYLQFSVCVCNSSVYKPIINRIYPCPYMSLRYNNVPTACPVNYTKIVHVWGLRKVPSLKVFSVVDIQMKWPRIMEAWHNQTHTQTNTHCHPSP